VVFEDNARLLRKPGASAERAQRALDAASSASWLLLGYGGADEETWSKEAAPIIEVPWSNGKPLAWGTQCYCLDKTARLRLISWLRGGVVGLLPAKGNHCRGFKPRPIDRLFVAPFVAEGSIFAAMPPVAYRAPMLRSLIHEQWDSRMCEALEKQLAFAGDTFDMLWLTEEERRAIIKRKSEGIWEHADGVVRIDWVPKPRRQNHKIVSTPTHRIQNSASSSSAAPALMQSENIGQLVYLQSGLQEETPRYPSLADCPKLLHAELRKDVQSFLLRGPDSPAVEVHLPPQPLLDSSKPIAPTATLQAAILVCPGGGYKDLAVHEAAPVLPWLAKLGVVAFVLRYRLPPKHPWPAALEDIRAALALMESPRARQEWNVDSTRLAILGFSAGAHLAAQVAAQRRMQQLSPCGDRLLCEQWFWCTLHWLMLMMSQLYPR